MTGAVLFGAVENSCLGLQGLSPSYFHPSHRGRNSSGPGEGEGEKGQLRVNFPFWPSLGGAPQLGSMPHPSQTVLGTWASGDGRGARAGFLFGVAVASGRCPCLPLVDNITSRGRTYRAKSQSQQAQPHFTQGETEVPRKAGHAQPRASSPLSPLPLDPLHLGSQGSRFCHSFANFCSSSALCLPSCFLWVVCFFFLALWIEPGAMRMLAR